MTSLTRVDQFKKKKKFGDFVVYQFLLLRQQRAVLIGSVLLSPNMLLFANGAVQSILKFFALSSLAWSWSRVNIVCLGLLLVSIYPVLIASWAPSLGDPGYITKWWLGAIRSFVLFFSGNSLRYILWSRSQEKNPNCDFWMGQRGDAVGKTVNLQEAGCGFDAWHPATFSVEIVHFDNEHLR